MKFFRYATIRQKLMVLSLIALVAVAIPSALLTREKAADLAVAQRSADSETVFTELLQALKASQTSRGLSAGVLSGNESMASALKTQQSLATQRFVATAQAMRDTAASPALLDNLTELQTRFGVLAGEVQARSVTPPQSFARHTALIADLLSLLDLVMDDYGLSLEPNADLYFLMQGSLVHMPWLTEYLGQIRGLGNGLLVSGVVTPEGRLRLSVLMDNAHQRAASAQLQAGKALAINSTFQGALAPALKTATLAADRAVGLARTGILESNAPTLAAADYFKQTTEGIDAVFVVMENAIGEINRQLEKNVRRDRATLVAAATALAGLLVLLVITAVAITRSIVAPLDQAIALANSVAQGDLTQQARAEGEGETARLLKALLDMQQGLVRVVGDVRRGASSVALSSREIEQGAADLSRRTESQASSLEETAASMEQLAATVSQNSESIDRSSRTATQSAQVAERAGEAVGAFVLTMTGIHQSSSKISEIISVIDGIAFQTNILALNAAVEAARAGEAGRGFAVVASEVRNLAQRSAEAAKQIKSLITESVQRVEDGTEQVAKARQTVQEVVEGIAQLSAMMAQIMLASHEQRAGLQQVTQAVTQMDEATQQNAALVEQSAAAGAALRQQADELAQAVLTFKLPAGAGG